MKKLLFTSSGRISRRQYLLAMLVYIGIIAVATLVGYALQVMFPTFFGEDGAATVPGVPTYAYSVLLLGCILVFLWSGICVNAKRCHDRGRSGWFQLVQLIPMVGPIWWFIEAAFLHGTPGPNRFGADPLATLATVVPSAVTA